jgi:hypothetical protein
LAGTFFLEHLIFQIVSEMASVLVRLHSDPFCYVKGVSNLAPTSVARASSLLKAALHKHKSVALCLWGQAGIGKTHRARDLLQSIPCQSLTLHASTSWATLAQALPSTKKLPIWAERSLEHLKQNKSLDAKQMLDALTALLTTLAPLLLHIEDLHEAGAERLEFWQALARAVTRTKGVGLIATSRTLAPEPFEAVQLLPLSHLESDELLRRDIGEIPRDAIHFIL